MSYGMGNTGTNPGTNNTGKPFKEKIPKGYQAGALQQFTPEMMQLFQSLFGHLGPESYTARLAGGDQNLFNEIEAPALQQFSALQGNLASRFSGSGGLGSRKSSGFQNTMNQAGSDFAQQLQAQRQGLQRQAIQDLMGLSGNLLNQKPFERTLVEKEPSFFDKWLALAGRTLGAAKQGAQMSGGGF